MEEIALLSKDYTKRLLVLLTAGQYWGIAHEFKMAPGLTADDIDQAVRDFELSYSRLVMPPETALNSVKIFNFDDKQWALGPPAKGLSHNTIIYVADGGTKWSQDFFLWSAIGRSRHMLKMVFRITGEELVVSYDGIYQP